MANWIRCASASDSSVFYYVNLEHVTCLTATEAGTSVQYAGSDKANIEVVGTPDDVLSGETVRWI